MLWFFDPKREPKSAESNRLTEPHWAAETFFLELRGVCATNELFFES
jgi:hypothetical protein